MADKLQNEKAKTLLYVATIVDSANMLRQQAKEIESLEKAFEGERKYARYLSKLCIDNKIPIVWFFKESE